MTTIITITRLTRETWLLLAMLSLGVRSSEDSDNGDADKQFDQGARGCIFGGCWIIREQHREYMNIIKILEVSILRAQARLQSLNACRKVKSEYKLHQAVGRKRGSMPVWYQINQPPIRPVKWIKSSSVCHKISLFWKALNYGVAPNLHKSQIYTGTIYSQPRFTQFIFAHRFQETKVYTTQLFTQNTNLHKKFSSNFAQTISSEFHLI